MAGSGSRFKSHGSSLPKPLVEVDGGPMFAQALRFLEDVHCEWTLTCVIQSHDDDNYGLGTRICEVVADARVVRIPGLTGGAAQSALAAMPYLEPESPVLIVDCDMRFTSQEFNEIVGGGYSDMNLDGALLSFPSSESRFSYAEVRGGLVVRTAEKRPISSNALIGAYFFATASSFADGVAALMSRALEADAPEYYISMVYNELIQRGARIGMAEGSFTSFGTPEELNSYLALKTDTAAGID